MVTRVEPCDARNPFRAVAVSGVPPWRRPVHYQPEWTTAF